MPDSVFKKFILSIVIGLVCLIVAVISVAVYKDVQMFFLSVVIASGMFVKSFLMYYRFKNGNFVTIKGECIKISGALFAKYKKVDIKTEKERLTLFLPKDIKIALNETYNFYFKKKVWEITPVYNKYITTKLNSDNFLGLDFVCDSENSENT